MTDGVLELLDDAVAVEVAVADGDGVTVAEGVTEALGCSRRSPPGAANDTLSVRMRSAPCSRTTPQPDAEP